MTPYNAPFFLSDDEARRVASSFGTPTYVYDEGALRQAADELLGVPARFGFTARFAMKALPTRAIVRLLSSCGLHIDASSGFEAERALAAGVPGENILLTAQELPASLSKLVERGVRVNACSLAQLARFGKEFPGRTVSIRVNPGLGSGHCNRTNVGGPSSSFGIWHEHIDQALSLAKEYGLTVERVHSHIGSGSDPETWEYCCALTLNLVRRFPSASIVNLGGGFKVARMPNEKSADLAKTGKLISARLEKFAAEENRKLHLELEPGTYLVARAGAIVASVIDVVSTGDEGYSFIKIDSGMTEIARPSLYGAQHPIKIVTAGERPCETGEFVVVGHCCESGDVLTPGPGNPEELLPRTLTAPLMGDICVIGYTGAYCSGFSMKHYNSFPEAAEVLRRSDGSLEQIKRRGTWEQALINECD